MSRPRALAALSVFVAALVASVEACSGPRSGVPGEGGATEDASVAVAEPTLCRGSGCAAPTPEAAPDECADAAPDVSACAAMVKQAEAEVDDAIDAVEVDAGCTKDSDCIAVPFATLCTSTCGDAIVPKAGAASVQAQIDESNATTCATFASAGCACTGVGHPCPPVSNTPACVGGRCIAR